MDALVNDKQTYEELKRDLTSALQRKLNSTLLTLKKINTIDNQRYYRLRCSVQQPSKLFLFYFFKFFKFFYVFLFFAIETLWSAETTQTWIPKATYCFFL